MEFEFIFCSLLCIFIFYLKLYLEEVELNKIDRLEKRYTIFFYLYCYLDGVYHCVQDFKQRHKNDRFLCYTSLNRVMVHGFVGICVLEKQRVKERDPNDR